MQLQLSGRPASLDCLHSFFLRKAKYSPCALRAVTGNPHQGSFGIGGTVGLRGAWEASLFAQVTDACEFLTLVQSRLFLLRCKTYIGAFALDLYEEIVGGWWAPVSHPAHFSTAAGYRGRPYWCFLPNVFATSNNCRCSDVLSPPRY